MALVTKVTPSIDTITAKNAPQISGLYAGEALEIASPCYIASSDGLVYLCNSTNDDEETELVGFTPRAVAAGEPVTLFGKGARFKYASGLTAGNYLYIGTTNGRLDTVPQVGSPEPVAFCLSATDIMVAADFRAKHAGNNLHVNLISGGAAGDHVLATIADGDQLVFVGQFSTEAAIATLDDLTAEFTVKAGGGAINNALGTDTTNDQLFVLWYDLT